MEPTELLLKYALEASVIIGVTSVLGKFLSLFKFWSDRVKDAAMPFTAMLVAVGVVMLKDQVLASQIYTGIVLGGTVTGLYAVAKARK